MKIASGWCRDTRTEDIKKSYEDVAAQLLGRPSLLIVYCSATCDANHIITTLGECAPRVSLHGGTSCRGVMTDEGVDLRHGHNLGLLALRDERGRYGTGAAVIGFDPQAAARKAVEQALQNAGCPGEVPSLVLMTAAPGCEESLITGIASVVGGTVPIAGGSSADDRATGAWKQFGNDQVYSNAVVVTVLFPSAEVIFGFHSGFEPAGSSGMISRAGSIISTAGRAGDEKSGRMLWEIEERPAAEVYSEWIKKMIPETLVQAKSGTLKQRMLYPLGRVAGRVGEFPYYQLIYSAAVREKGLMLLADVAEGEELFLMQGTLEGLITRPARVASTALKTNAASAEDVAGALVFFCAGALGSLQSHLPKVVESLRTALPEIPFLGAFPFGEQGPFWEGKNCHGNLMVSVLLFTKNNRY